MDLGSTFYINSSADYIYRCTTIHMPTYFQNYFTLFDTPYNYFYYICMKLWCTM